MTYYMSKEALEDLQRQRDEAMKNAFNQIDVSQSKASYYVGLADGINHIIANTITVDSKGTINI